MGALHDGALIGIRASVGSAAEQFSFGTRPEAVRKAVGQGNCRGRSASDCAAALRSPGILSE